MANAYLIADVGRHTTLNCLFDLVGLVVSRQRQQTRWIHNMLVVATVTFCRLDVCWRMKMGAEMLAPLETWEGVRRGQKRTCDS